MFERIVIFGCGLIGSSLAASARKSRLAREIFGVDNRYELMKGKNLFFDEIFKSIKKCSHAELFVIAVPLKSISTVVKDLAHSQTNAKYELITDVASNKRSLINALKELPEESKQRFLSKFISSHPLAGSEHGGWENASSDLFEKTVCLLGVPGLNFIDKYHAAVDEDCDSFKRKVNKIEKFWQGVGCRVEHFPLEEHDQFLSIISHFPHLLAFSTGEFMSSSNYGEISKTIYGTGFKDFTRISAAPPNLWADILLENRDYVLSNGEHWLESYKRFLNALKKRDRTKLVSLISRSSYWRSNLEKLK